MTTPPCSNFDGQSNGDQPSSSSRWNPTPEQLLALEELYRLGLRTPTATQIQTIAARLRRFGKIEGKNVFYWFQNHKARERQKRRRGVLETASKDEEAEEQRDVHDETLGKRETGLRRTGYEAEETKTRGPPSNSTRHSEGSTAATAESGPNGWIPLQERELHQKRKQTLEYNLSYSPISFINLINTTPLDLLNSSPKSIHENFTNLEEENREDQTLELFPLQSSIRDQTGINFGKKLDTQFHITTINRHTNFTPNQYIEFLPLKN
ncbi:hypothetical protein SLEP1_g11085 [Rubroshorea leprosula]|uniref:Homeobox domain-containing protein n=1 Tax=Rubroshorea leprosula TaxID=152421 RepID=A0AAV5IFZ1_9ROSI|nr:hypothetical protein SLEP1_g11082 [Rubroshorea leprosula]GKU98030.1 hypothetical protein SLEP1_g11085 [Rubroshorea leprosula]